MVRAKTQDETRPNPIRIRDQGILCNKVASTRSDLSRDTVQRVSQLWNSLSTRDQTKTLRLVTVPSGKISKISRPRCAITAPSRRCSRIRVSKRIPGLLPAFRRAEIDRMAEGVYDAPCLSTWGATDKLDSAFGRRTVSPGRIDR